MNTLPNPVRPPARADTHCRPLKIGLISYRSNPHCGGQGVYLKNLSAALRHLGHHVEVFSGPPDLKLEPGLPLHRIDCLDLYNPADPFRVPSLRELGHPVNLVEWMGVSTMGFPEPFTFGIRAYRFLRGRLRHFDILHDNQSLSYGIWALNKLIPTVATIHHPITVDRAIAIKAAGAPWKKLKQARWFSFVGMQKKVARSLPRIITVSECARRDISRDFRIAPRRFRVIPNGINTELFRPLPAVERESNRLLVTNSADVPLKGLNYLMQAVARVADSRQVRLVVVGAPSRDGEILQAVHALDIGGRVTFTGRISDDELIRQYARATAAVVPSVYEGFGIPAGEAMACRVPVISTTGGALPEVVGEAGILVPPADPEALAKAIADLLDNPQRAGALGAQGYRRVQRHFTWRRAAQKTIAAYHEVIRAHH